MINCVCHCIRAMFRVLGMYNFAWLVTLDRDQRGNVSACKVVEKSSGSPETTLHARPNPII